MITNYNLLRQWIVQNEYRQWKVEAKRDTPGISVSDQIASLTVSNFTPFSRGRYAIWQNTAYSYFYEILIAFTQFFWTMVAHDKCQTTNFFKMDFIESIIFHI